MASPLTIQPSTIDTDLNMNAPTTNYGGATSCYVESTTNGNPNTNRRTLQKFAIVWGTDIPAGATITGATFSMYARTITNSAGRTYLAYKLTRADWVEAEATWNIYKTGSNWTTAGGDYVTSSPAGGSTTVPVSAGTMSWDVLAIVKDAQTNNLNVNILVRDQTEDSGATIRLTAFDSSEGTTTPSLVITYTESGGAPTTKIFGARMFVVGSHRCKLYHGLLLGR